MSAASVENFGLLTDVGRVRSENEDSLLAKPPLFAVADGLGGHLAGEIASSVAIKTLVENAPLHADSKALARAIHAANRSVIDAAEERASRSGMGTTLTAAIVEGTHIAIAHVGDSRAYLLHEGVLRQLTEDHSMVADMIRRGQLTEEESRYHPNRSVITRALGTDPNMCADTYDFEAVQGDRLLLATDGLSGMLLDDEIEALLAANAHPQDAARALVDAANEAGGQDNISVVVVDIGGGGRFRQAARAVRGTGTRLAGGSPGGRRPTETTADSSADFPVGRSASRATRRFATRPGEELRARALPGWIAVLAWVIVAALLVATGAYLTYRYARSQAYLIEDERGRVVVYRGLPGSLGGITLNWREEETTIPANALPPSVAARLTEGIRVENMSAARALVEQYRSELPTPAVPDSSPSSFPSNF